MSELFDRYLRTLGETEWTSPAELTRYQRVLIGQLVRHAYANVPFYRDRLKALFTTDDAVDLARWNEIPALTRADATAHADAMRAPEIPAAWGAVSEFWTSGTSGMPLKFTANSLARVAYNAAMTRLAMWVGANPGKPLAQIRVFRSGEAVEYPEGRSWRGWSMAAPDAPSYGLDLRTPVRQQIEWLSRRRCRYLTTSPSNAMAIAYAVTPEQAHDLDIEIIFSVGETIIPGARELVRQRLGARLVGVYSCEEVGYIATECPVNPHYHVVTENTLVEIVDDNGQPVEPGTSGRVLVTGLYNYATPFIRYDLGDIAIADPALCSCGRTLPVIAEIRGRTRNAFIFRDGRRAWPRIWDARAMQALVPCREFRVVQVDFENVEFRYVSDGSKRAPDIEGLNTYAREHLHPSVVVKPVVVESMATLLGEKHEPFISLVTTS